MRYTQADEPAFPAPGGHHSGMTMREYYAAVALQGMLGAGAQPNTNNQGGRNWDWIAKEAFEVADAMITEAKKGGG